MLVAACGVRRPVRAAVELGVVALAAPPTRALGELGTLFSACALVAADFAFEFAGQKRRGAEDSGASALPAAGGAALFDAPFNGSSNREDDVETGRGAASSSENPIGAAAGTAVPPPPDPLRDTDTATQR